MKRLALFPLILTLGCPTTEEHEDPALHACEALTETPEMVTAAADRDSAPEIHPEEVGLEVALDGGAGWLEIHTTEDTAALLFVDAEAVVTGLYFEDGTDNVLPTASPNEDCAIDLPEHFDLDLEPGHWALEFGPSTLDSVWIMLIGAEGHDHDE